MCILQYGPTFIWAQIQQITNLMFMVLISHGLCLVYPITNVHVITEHVIHNSDPYNIGK
jgi:hypothetical protein